MKKDRDCNCNAGMAPYPIYPAYMPGMSMPMIPTPGMMPNAGMMPNTGMIPNNNMMMQPNMGTTNPGTNYPQSNGTIEQQIYNLSNQISSLERRVSNLEGLIGNSGTQYNTSNYQVM